MSILIFPAIALLLMFVFRLEGGGFYKFGNDTTPRLIRALVFQLCSNIVLHLSSLPVREGLIAGFLLGIGSYVAANMPHAAFQGMGAGNQPQTYWWTPWLPSSETWTAFTPMWIKILWDFSGMAAVGLVCGVLTYIPYGIFTHDIRHSIYAVIAVAIFQPTAYLIGRALAELFPFLKFQSTEYGETGTGLGWAFSLKAFFL